MTQLEPDSLVHPMPVQQHQQRSAGAIGLGNRPQHLISFDAHCYPEVPELSGMGSDGAAASPSADPGSKGACSDWRWTVLRIARIRVRRHPVLAARVRRTRSVCHLSPGRTTRGHRQLRLNRCCRSSQFS